MHEYMYECMKTLCFQDVLYKNTPAYLDYVWSIHTAVFAKKVFEEPGLMSELNI